MAGEGNARDSKGNNDGNHPHGYAAGQVGQAFEWTDANMDPMLITDSGDGDLSPAAATGLSIDM